MDLDVDSHFDWLEPHKAALQARLLSRTISDFFYDEDLIFVSYVILPWERDYQK